MGTYGEYEKYFKRDYFKPDSDSSSYDSTRSSNTDSDSDSDSDSGSDSDFPFRPIGGRRPSITFRGNSSPSSDSDSSSNHSSYSSSPGSSTPSRPGSADDSEEPVGRLFEEEGVRVITIVRRQVEVQEKRLLQEISRLGIKASDFQRPILPRLIIDKCDDYISTIRSTVNSTVSNSQLPGPSRRHAGIEDALLDILEPTLEDTLETIEAHLNNKIQQPLTVIPRHPGPVVTYINHTDPRFNPPPRQNHPIPRPGQNLPILRPGQQPPAPKAGPPKNPIEDLDSRRERKASFWNHFTISRDQTSASNFAKEILLAVLRKGINNRSSERLDWDAGKQNSLIRPAPFVAAAHLRLYPAGLFPGPPRGPPGPPPPLGARVPGHAPGLTGIGIHRPAGPPPPPLATTFGGPPPPVIPRVIQPPPVITRVTKPPVRRGISPGPDIRTTKSPLAHLSRHQRWPAFPDGTPGHQHRQSRSKMRPFSGGSSSPAQDSGQPGKTTEKSLGPPGSDVSPLGNPQQMAVNGTSPATSIISNQDKGTSLQNAESSNHTMARMVQIQPDLSSRGSLDYLIERIHLLEAENKNFRESQGNSLRIETLYTISEGPGVPATTFLDEPTWVIGPRGQAMLKAHYSIPDTNGYLSQQHDVAFVVMKFYDLDEQGEEAADAHRDKRALPRPQPSTELIRLESAELIEAVEAFFAQQPKFAEDFPNFKIKHPISAPYLFWYHYRSPTALDGLSASHADTIRVLTSWIDEHYGELYSSVQDQLSEGVTSVETIEFLFKPGEVLVFEEKNDMVAAIATSRPTVRSKPSPKLTSRDSTWKKGKGETTDDAAFKWKWQVNAWQYHYDGSFQRRNRSTIIILQSSSPTEKVPIVKLSAYPLKYASDALRARLQLRGETFWKCRFRRLVSYKDEKGLVGTGERFMIDFETYEQLHSDSANFKRIYGKFEESQSEPMDPEVMASDDPPGVPEIYVFPPKITGYNLRSKKWDDLLVDLIQDVVWNKKSFEHLVIDFETKELVQALVTNQIESEQNTDIIEQKGNGLIILLHGGPGTGKTFTAESVAEMAEKPLFRVTCGDIGTKPEVVEKYLESVLYLGKSWGCVVLLDEADVFLEQRTLTDLERNALVSVFLRVLEYYEGILILTSNRVGTFDEAFKSRIQLALHYQNLTEGQRRKIWKNFFNRLRGLDADSLASSSEESLKGTRKKPLDPMRIDFDDIECYLTDLAKYELNGRQIRNAITTARQLAKFKDEKMAFHHLKHVITVSAKFDTYLQTVQEGFTDDQVARGGGIR